MAATLADVAARAGVSRQTVSNVISNPHLVKEDTLVKVRQAIKDLRYTPNLRARMLRQQRTGTIGMRIQPPSDNVAGVLLDRFLHELSARAALREKHVLIFTASSDEEEVTAIERLVAQSVVDEFVLTGTHPGDQRIAALTAAGHKFVSFGRPWGSELPAPHSWVDVNGHYGTATATQALLDHGAHTIGFLGWPSDQATGDDRRQGWLETMRKAGWQEPDLKQLIATSTDDVSEAISAGSSLIEQGAEAFVCASDTLATGMVAALRSRGLSLPIIGFDNTPFAASLGFSSVDQELGLVADAVLDGLAAATSSSTIITPRLHIRHDPRWGLQSPTTQL